MKRSSSAYINLDFNVTAAFFVFSFYLMAGIKSFLILAASALHVFDLFGLCFRKIS